MKSREELQKDFSEVAFRIGTLNLTMNENKKEIDRLTMQAENIKIDFAKLPAPQNVQPIKPEEKKDVEESK